MGEQQGKRASHGFFGRLRLLARWAVARKPVRAFLLYQGRHGPMLADSVTYRALFSVFAGVFLGFSIAGVWLAGRPDAITALVETLDTAIPGLVGDDGLLAPEDLVQPITFSVTGVIALIGLVGAAIGAIGSLRVAFRSLAGRPDDDTFFVWLLARDLLLAIGFGAALAAAAAVTFFGTAAIGMVAEWFGGSTRDPLYGAAERLVSTVVIFAIDALVIATMFRVLSGMRPAASRLWPGALLGGAALTVLQLLSGLFVGGAASNPLLASVVALVALLIWFNLSSQAILLAAAYIVVGVDDDAPDRRGAGAETGE
ncbi:YihY/virulence factor BrkB family protein [Agromyces italicus]|uniref:YihY/virulence factor BrkB family protein n=1 Tax=Agromyces italicus TaxID=279572 RepID=UPI0003B686BD|nr:YihY/virulence factor BrkB family protein [Agromyces italicus]